MYYSLYRGWSVDFTALFIHPAFALCWMRWMSWKDMVLHLWTGETYFPTWHCCVCVVVVKLEDVELVSKQQKPLFGETSRKFFNRVDVYRYIGTCSMMSNILKCPDNLYRECLNMFKTHADYEQSANSIFKGGSEVSRLVDTIDHKIMGWLVVTPRDIHVCEPKTDGELIDIGSSARYHLKKK